MNPIINTRVYDMMFPDGSIQQYAANLIAENIYSQVDKDGHKQTLIGEIVDHRKEDTAYDKANGFVTDKYGNKSCHTTTKGWKLLVNWKDGTQSWIPLTEVKDSNPIEVAEYAVTKGIDEEPAFEWWVPFTLRKRDRSIAAVNNKTKKKSHKYDIEVPRSIAHAYELNQKNGDTFWRDAIKKEMTNVLVAFEILGHGQDAPRNFKELGVHLIFDMKMDMTQKARLVANGHKVANPEGSTYAGVVPQETVRIAFTCGSQLIRHPSSRYSECVFNCTDF